MPDRPTAATTGSSVGQGGSKAHHHGGVRLNDEEKGQIDEPDVVLDTAEAPAKTQMLAFATFQAVIWEMSLIYHGRWEHRGRESI